MNTNFARLRPYPVRRIVSNPDIDLNLALGCSLPPMLVELMSTAGAPVGFKSLVRYKPIEPCGSEDKEGYESMLMFLGPGDGPDSIISFHRWPPQDLPEDLLPIATTPGGDLICLSRDTGRVLRWSHEMPEDANYDEAVSLVAEDFEAFAEALEVDPAGERNIATSEGDANYGNLTPELIARIEAIKKRLEEEDAI